MVRVQFLPYSGHFLLKVENFIFDPITKSVQCISVCIYNVLYNDGIYALYFDVI